MNTEEYYKQFEADYVITGTLRLLSQQIRTCLEDLSEGAQAYLVALRRPDGGEDIIGYLREASTVCADVAKAIERYQCNS